VAYPLLFGVCVRCYLSANGRTFTCLATTQSHRQNVQTVFTVFQQNDLGKALRTTEVTGTANRSGPPNPRRTLRVVLGLYMAGAGFEPAKAEPRDLQSRPFDRSGIPPGVLGRV
jgi:hypothetical protein